MLCDLLISAGVYALIGWEVTPSTIIGFLTILGFSLYDKMVVFDKVRENTTGVLDQSRSTYAERANLAVNQTLVRSINTSVVALLPVAGILFVGALALGAGTLRDLSLSLFVGIAVGAASSIFLATPLDVALRQYEPKIAAHTAAVLAERKRLAEGGADAVAAANDPLIGLVEALDPLSRELRKRHEDEVQSVERAAYAKIAAARFAVFGEGVYPDATFTLRLSYGAVKGYKDGDRDIPPFTEFAGVFEKAQERAGEAWYTLPESWTKKADSIAPKTQFNFVSTNDIIGGNSGSPVIDKQGEVVGLIFDGNIQSLIGNYAYSEVQARSVSVDSRGIMGALHQVYGAKRIVDELQAPAIGG
jgi:hypothetical protein